MNENIVQLKSALFIFIPTIWKNYYNFSMSMKDHFDLIENGYE